MRIEQLNYFYHSVKFKSMSTAAEYLHITPQAMSMAIKALEKELSTTLLEKKPSGVCLTETGAEILPLVEKILEFEDQIQKCCSKEADPRECIKGHLHIYTTPLLSSYHIGSNLLDFRKHYPNVQINLYQNTASDSVEQMYSTPHSFSIINAKKEFITELQQNTPRQYTIDILYISKVCAIISKDSPLSQMSEVSFKQLKKLPFLATTENNFEDFGVVPYLQKYGKIKIDTICTNAQFLISSVCKNLGICFCFGEPLMFLEAHLQQQLQTLAIKGAPEHFIAVIYKKDITNDPAAKEYLTQLKEFWRTLPGNQMMKYSLPNTVFF